MVNEKALLGGHPSVPVGFCFKSSESGSFPERDRPGDEKRP